MKKNFWVILVLFVLAANAVMADNVGLAVKNKASLDSVHETPLKTILQSMGHTVTLIDQTNAGTVDFGTINLIVVSGTTSSQEALAYTKNLPVNSKPTISLYPGQVKNWGWVSTTGIGVESIGYSPSYSATYSDQGYQIVDSLSSSTVLQNPAGNIDLLVKSATNFKSLANLNILPSDGFIMLTEKGSVLKSGATANGNLVFFGIASPGYWTAATTNTFQKAVTWALKGKDSDSDGIIDEQDNCPNNANANQADADQDGKGDVCDACPNDANNDVDGDGVCGNVDNCPSTANANQADADQDGTGDVCDACPNDANNDADKDGFCANVDNCPTIANANQADADQDGIGNVCDACPNDPQNDVDADGVCGDVDNCATVANTNQADADGDGIGNVCDACPNDALNDADQDGFCADVDNCPTNANANQADADQDGKGDVCDACPNDANNDADKDGLCANVDNCPTIANANQADADADGKGDVCDACPNDALNDGDLDGLCAQVDNCPYNYNPDQQDLDGDGKGSACDSNEDMQAPVIELVSPADGKIIKVTNSDNFIDFYFKVTDDIAATLNCQFYSTKYSWGNQNGDFVSEGLPKNVANGATDFLFPSAFTRDEKIRWNILCSDGANTAFASKDWYLKVLTDGHECLDASDCNDNLYCDGIETCGDDFQCHAGTAPACNDGLWCNGAETCDEGADSCAAGTPPACNDGLWCNGAETCDENADSCAAGTSVDCSGNNLPVFGACNNNPDSNPLTWDYAAAFVSTCDDNTDSCTIGQYNYIYTCDASCGAECVADVDCQATDCDSQDGCVGGDYYDYSNVGNSCSEDCTCTQNVCAEPAITLGDGRCFCSSNDDCNDGLYCNGLEYCGGDSKCYSADPVFCAGLNLAEIATCGKSPDGNPLTWDFAAEVVATCNEETDSCTVGEYGLTHACSVESCSAECDAENACAVTKCTDLNGCHEGRKYNCNVANTCNGNCTCTKNECPADYAQCSLVGTDTDADGVDEACDPGNSIIGDTNNVKGNVAGLVFEVGGVANPITANGSADAVFKDGDGNTLVEFTYNFTTPLDLTKVSITVNSEAGKSSIIISGLNLGEGNTKTVYIGNIEARSDTLCIFDQDGVTSLAVRGDCGNGVKLDCPGTNGGYSCELVDNATRFKVSGLKHSGVTEYYEGTDATESTSQSSGGGGGGRSFSVTTTTTAPETTTTAAPTTTTLPPATTTTEAPATTTTIEVTTTTLAGTEESGSAAATESSGTPRKILGVALIIMVAALGAMLIAKGRKRTRKAPAPAKKAEKKAEEPNAE